MRKYFSLFFLAPVLGVMLLSAGCSDDPDPLAAEKNAVLLGGKKGQTKVWFITSVTLKQGGGSAQELSLSDCFLDNKHTFSNNDSQYYRHNEGSSVCDEGDPDLVEEGTWAFTLDGESLIISANKIYSEGPGLFYYLPYPCTVVTLTETSMVLEVTIQEGGDSLTYTITFDAA